MAERHRNREIVERMTGEFKRHQDQLGRPITGQQAHETIAAMARQRDRERANGDHRNKKKGVESGKRRARDQAETKGQQRQHQETLRRMNAVTFVDFGNRGRGSGRGR